MWPFYFDAVHSGPRTAGEVAARNEEEDPELRCRSFRCTTRSVNDDGRSRRPAPGAALAGALVAEVADLAIRVVDTGWQATIVRLLTGACHACVYPPAMKTISTWFRVSSLSHSR